MTADYNGYRSGLSSLGGTHNKTIYNSDYQSSFLGDLYYPTSGTNLATLIDAGSRTASSAGLSSYATVTNQVADSGTVDIGQHYFAVSTNTTVTIQATTPIAVEGGGTPGVLTVSRTGPTASALTVYYGVGGTAIPGTDYQTLSNYVQIPANQASQNINVSPISKNSVDVDKTVTASLVLNSNYFVGSPPQATVTIQNTDPPTNVVTVATLFNPTGIDYNTNNGSLIVSVNYPNGGTNNFVRIQTNGTVSTWTTIKNLTNEIKIAAVKVSTNGFTAGDMYFGTGVAGQIGWASANGSSFNTNWTILSGETNLFRGALYVDQTGVFSNDLIAVTGGTPGDLNSLVGGTVWRIHSATNATKLAQVSDDNGNWLLCEGLLTVPNDAAKYGPWAGKVLAGAEQQFGGVPGRIYAIDPGGAITAYDLGICEIEDIDLIPSGQNLYGVVFVQDGTSTVYKVPAGNFANFAGDILITQEGGPPAALFVVRWEGGRFVVREILESTSPLEHVVFAPIDIPAQ